MRWMRRVTKEERNLLIRHGCRRATFPAGEGFFTLRMNLNGVLTSEVDEEGAYLDFPCTLC